VIAFVFNIMIQIFFAIPPVELFKGFSIIKLFNMTYIVPLLWAWIPLIIGSFALRSDTLLIRSLGSHLPSGYLVYLNLISKIFSLSTSVMTIGIQIVLLPHLVEYITAKKYEKAIQNVSKAKLGAVLISLFVTVSLVLVGPFLIKLLFVGGKFTSADADITITLLPLFILPSIGWGINSVFFQPLLALRKQLQLGLLYLMSLVLGWGIGTFITSSIGPLPGITSGLIVMLFTGIIGSEILWQYYKKKLIYIHHERNSSI
ncbi:MAG: lipid II flippase MurJ, partial [bacterium]|nr:lipid II flippase MurJ [bacterium]